MPFFKIVHTYAELKQIRQFWEEMRNEAKKIHDEYTNDKDDKYHTQFYKRLTQKNATNRPDFFEPYK